MKKLRTFIGIIALSLLFGCFGLFDHNVEWEDSPYQLVWIDTRKSMSLNYHLGGGNSIGRVEETVFSVGSNRDYIVAAQHPNGNRSIIRYYIINRASDHKLAEPKDVVIGPLSADEFEKMKQSRDLPTFSTTLDSLQ